MAYKYRYKGEISQKEKDRRVLNVIFLVIFIIGIIGIVAAAIVTTSFEMSEEEISNSLVIELILFGIGVIFLIPWIVFKIRDRGARRDYASSVVTSTGNIHYTTKAPEKPGPRVTQDYHNYDENGNERAQSGWNGESKDEHEFFEDVVEDAELFDELDDDG